MSAVPGKSLVFGELPLLAGLVMLAGLLAAAAHAADAGQKTSAGFKSVSFDVKIDVAVQRDKNDHHGEPNTWAWRSRNIWLIGYAWGTPVWPASSAAAAARAAVVAASSRRPAAP